MHRTLFFFLSQENDLKRARALKKAKVEEELGRQKDKEIERYINYESSGKSPAPSFLLL